MKVHTQFIDEEDFPADLVEWLRPRRYELTKIALAAQMRGYVVTANLITLDFESEADAVYFRMCWSEEVFGCDDKIIKSDLVIKARHRRQERNMATLSSLHVSKL